MKKKDSHNFLGKCILVLTAHPDDEQLAAGTMYENCRAGGKTFLVCATAGERGKSHLARPMTDTQLKKVRRGELLRAAKILQVNKVLFLNMPDAGLKAREHDLFKKMFAQAKLLKPEQILSFGPDGISAHWDHITVGKIARKISRELRIPLAAFTFHPAIERRRRTLLLTRRKFGSYADFVATHRRGDIKIAIKPAIKKKAMAAHKSQFSDGGWIKTLPKEIKNLFFKEEHFVREKV